MNTGAHIVELAEAGEAQLAGSRPVFVNAHGEVLVRTPRGILTNSLLREDEWKVIDQAVITASRAPLRVVQTLRSRGLTRQLGGLGTLMAQWYMRGEVTAANVSMTGQGINRDLPDLKQAGVPVPIISKEFAIDIRTLQASRRLGDGIDVAGAEEAARVVSEALDTMVLNGASSIVLHGSTIYGLTTHPQRNTDTAANYGGGDWGTITNIIPTVAGMVAAANADYHYGPFGLFIATTQYNQAALTFFADVGDTPLQRLQSLPNIATVEMLPTLADGVVLLVDMTREVVELAEALPVQTREWASPDGMTSVFRVMTAVTVMVKADYNNRSGIVHATAA